MFDHPSNEFGLFPGGRREWEPENVSRFGEIDPLNPEFNEWGETLLLLYDAEIEFIAWSRLPALLRGQAWRERELAAFLRRESFQQQWADRPLLRGFEKMSVGRRPWAAVGPLGIGIAMSQSRRLMGYRNALCAGHFWEALSAYRALDKEGQQLLRWDPLTIVLSFQDLSERATSLYEYIHLDPFLSIKSRVSSLDEYGLHEFVPVIFEESREYKNRSNVISGSELQSGQRIYTQPYPNTTIPGTITAIVQYELNSQKYTGLLAPQHVLRDVGEPVYQNGSKIGEVVYSDSVMDVALAKLSDSLQWRQEVLNRNLDPAPPILPVSGMPTEYYGSTSQSIEESYIGLVYISPPSFYRQGQAPAFEIEGGSADGDSGAMVLSGHNQQDADSPDLTRYVPSLQGDQLAAILGMLVAGVDANQCVKPATILATSAKDLQAALNNQGYKVRWLTR